MALQSRYFSFIPRLLNELLPYARHSHHPCSKLQSQRLREVKQLTEGSRQGVMRGEGRQVEVGLDPGTAVCVSGQQLWGLLLRMGPSETRFRTSGVCACGCVCVSVCV